MQTNGLGNRLQLSGIRFSFASHRRRLGEENLDPAFVFYPFL